LTTNDNEEGEYYYVDEDDSPDDPNEDRLDFGGEVIRLTNNEISEVEMKVLDAAKHVKAAMNFREFANAKTQQAKDTADKPNSEKTITIIGDYAQNGELPSFGCQQPGGVYYYSALIINIFSIVDTSFKQEKMWAYCYSCWMKRGK
jgi:hypothetical protein